MNSNKFVGIASVILAVTLISSPAISMAGTVKAKCQAQAREQKIAKKDMGEFMKKCYAEHKAKKKEMKKETKKELKKEEKKEGK
ncbi:MAG: hypothetical protein ACWGOV_03910 [Acidiferrobacterales bacterium]